MRSNAYDADSRWKSQRTQVGELFAGRVHLIHVLVHSETKTISQVRQVKQQPSLILILSKQGNKNKVSIILSGIYNMEHPITVDVFMLLHNDM